MQRFLQAQEFKTFCKNNGIFQKFIAPGHPATNGLAERNVQTLKHKLTNMQNEAMSIQEKVQEILFRYRATPLANNKTPSEQYLGRQIRIRLDALKPVKFSKTQFPTSMSRQLAQGESVQARYYANNKAIWKLGTITKKLGNLHYIVTLDDGFVFKRHINQLRSTKVTLVDNTHDEYHTNNNQHYTNFESNNRTDANSQQPSAANNQTFTRNKQSSIPNQQSASTSTGTAQPLTANQHSASTPTEIEQNSTANKQSASTFTGIVQPSTANQQSASTSTEIAQPSTACQRSETTSTGSTQPSTVNQPMASTSKENVTAALKQPLRVSSRPRKTPKHLADYIVESD